MQTRQRATGIIVAILALMAVTGAAIYQMTRTGQPTPIAGRSAAPADQKR
jgi:hypothetical protein